MTMDKTMEPDGRPAATAAEFRMALLLEEPKPRPMIGHAPTKAENTRLRFFQWMAQDNTPPRFQGALRRMSAFTCRISVRPQKAMLKSASL